MPSDALSIVLLSLFAILFVLIGRLEQRTRRNELRLQSLVEHFGIATKQHPTPSAKVLELLAQSNSSVAAIRQYRTEIGLGLKDAHDALLHIKASESGTASS